MKRAIIAFVAITSSSSTQAVTPSDLRDYAIASCLIKQGASPPLREEGYRLANVVLQRAGVDPFSWKPLQTAVEAALAQRGLLMVHSDGPVAQSTRPAPLASCLRVIDMPLVKGAMNRLSQVRR